jgi:quinohemoprotein amine dehydrogenase
MRKLSSAWVGLFALCVVPAVALGADAGGGGSGPAPSSPSVAPESEAGIPVTDKLVIEKCSACHAPDAKGNLSRISWLRTTPEGWAQAIRRMVRLNGLTLTPEEGRQLIKSLATSHGLAPEEARPVMYVPEKRLVQEPNMPEDTVTRETCTRCHEWGRGMSWRRSKSEWQLLQELHSAMFDQAAQAFRVPNNWPNIGAPPNPSGKTPGELAAEHLTKNAGLNTPEWASWRPRIREAKIAGRWTVSANVPGQGQFVGEMTVAPTEVPDEFRTTVTLKSVNTGQTLTRSGTGLVYAGYSWRGRSQGASKASRPDDVSSEARETLWFAPDQSNAEGRWYWGEYSEFGFDVKMKRAGTTAQVLAVTPSALKAGTTGTQVRILGENLPTAQAGDIVLGAGVKVSRVVSSGKNELVVAVDVDANAVSGKRDADVGGAVLENAVAVYHKLDSIIVTPERTIARLGSDVHPKGYIQFEAIGYDSGVDGKVGTPDDVAIGSVDVNWKAEEFLSVYGDDDVQFVGELNNRGFFTPASDGPNPKRKFGRNNYGDIWVVASSKTEKDKDGNAVSGRSRLIVTVPSYMRWDQPEVNQ